jgi:hypothetical protein
MFKAFSAFFVILKLVETGAGRGQQNGVSGGGMRAGKSHGAFKGAAIRHFNGSVQSLTNYGRGCIGIWRFRANQQNAFGPLVQRLA